MAIHYIQLFANISGLSFPVFTMHQRYRQHGTQKNSDATIANGNTAIRKRQMSIY